MLVRIVLQKKKVFCFKGVHVSKCVYQYYPLCCIESHVKTFYFFIWCNFNEYGESLGDDWKVNIEVL